MIDENEIYNMILRNRSTIDLVREVEKITKEDVIEECIKLVKNSATPECASTIGLIVMGLEKLKEKK